jgi:lysophospholipid acyltransferase (LPLAT)-like uncharacterized protein
MAIQLRMTKQARWSDGSPRLGLAIWLRYVMIPALAYCLSQGSALGLRVACGLLALAAFLSVTDWWVEVRQVETPPWRARAGLLAEQLLVSGPLAYLMMQPTSRAPVALALLGAGWLVVWLRMRQGAALHLCASGRAQLLLQMIATAMGLMAAAGLIADRHASLALAAALVATLGAVLRYGLLGVGGAAAPRVGAIPITFAQILLHAAMAPLAVLTAAYLVLVHATSRVRVIGSEGVDAVHDIGAPRLFACLHGRFLPLTPHRRGRGIGVFAAQNVTGALGALVALLMGYAPFRLRLGDRRSSIQAAERLTQWLAAGHDAALLADGPFGPYGEAKPLAISVARRAGAVIVPVTWDARPRTVLARRWDRALLPLPFSRSVIVYGEPIVISSSATPAEVEAARVRLTAALAEGEALAARLLDRGRAADHRLDASPPSGAGGLAVNVLTKGGRACRSAGFGRRTPK